ncbi:MAG TPA: hypothetical protein VFN85_11765 [Solirubrobacterales bacterium]|nr:hypothetical protein [Solirubrobacterales bacterium]HEX5592949.1 hypothetical protein [Solirubrobacterales bacterium]
MDIQTVLNIRTAIELHAERCARPPKAILLNPSNFDLLGLVEVLGLPVLPDDRVPVMRVRIHCGAGRGGRCEEGDVHWGEDGGAFVETGLD